MNVMDDTTMNGVGVDDKKVIGCLECQNEIALEPREYAVGDIIECQTCGTELEVTGSADGLPQVQMVILEK